MVSYDVSWLHNCFVVISFMTVISIGAICAICAVGAVCILGESVHKHIKGSFAYLLSCPPVSEGLLAWEM